MTGHTDAEIRVRSARPSDIPLLEHVERSAAELFKTVNLGFLADGPTQDPAVLSSMHDRNHLWVAVDTNDQPVAFLGGENLTDHFHILEISVAQHCQSKGIGKMLMNKMIDEVKQEGFGAVTLTTFRHLRWNGPWYKRMGFGEVDAKEVGEEYEDILRSEAEHGLTDRCVMLRTL